MENQTIMDKFNERNSFKQKLLFLEQKYSSLLEGRTESRKKNFLKLLNDYLPDGEKLSENGKIYEGFDNRDTTNDLLYDLKKQGLLGTLSKIDTDNLEKIFGMLAKNGKDIQNKNSLKDYNEILLNSLLEDLNQYKITKNQISTLEDEETDGHKNKTLFSLISRAIRYDLKDVLGKGDDILEKERLDVRTQGLKKFSVEYDEDGNEIKAEHSNDVGEILGDDFIDSVRKQFTDPIVFFHTVQRIYQKYNYVITARELGNLKNIFSDIKNGKMVFLTGDTGSGKTELCLLISRLYLDEIYGEGNKKEPIIVTGNSETDFSDFTMEKIVTSKNDLSVSDDALVIGMTEESGVTEEGGITKKMKLKECAKSFVDRINKSEEIKDISKEIVKTSDLSDKEKEDRLLEIDKQDLLKYNVFTEYHLQGMIKAMALGVPLIIDEMNGIRPEVLLGLNHYFTRKVGQKVSLGNGFTPIKIQKGFCIMCTGNDKDENSNAKRYRGRYTIDESLMNRMHRICKGYHRQEIKKFDNDNAGDFLDNSDMFDYMSENELYGVILMLFFSKKHNVKFNNIKNYDSESAIQSLTHTEITGFDIMKESFVGVGSNKEKKELFFKDLEKLAHFIKLVQDAFQGNITMCDGKTDVATLMKNSSGFSMRNVLDILNSYRNDTKSMWYHLYENYIKQIPETNDARRGAYLIAKEVGFLDKDIVISEKDNKALTSEIEKNLLQEKSMDFELMDAHNKKVEINPNLLSQGRIIITKQDMYKHYFGAHFGQGININNDQIKNFIQTEENIQENEETEEYSVYNIIASCENILNKLDNKDYQDFFMDNLDFKLTRILREFCNIYKIESNLEKYNQDEINELACILNKISNAIQPDNFDLGGVKKGFYELTKFNNK